LFFVHGPAYGGSLYPPGAASRLSLISGPKTVPFSLTTHREAYLKLHILMLSMQPFRSRSEYASYMAQRQVLMNPEDAGTLKGVLEIDSNISSHTYHGLFFIRYYLASLFHGYPKCP
jgi:hypothetical protein